MRPVEALTQLLTGGKRGGTVKSMRAWFEAYLANQQWYWREKLAACGVPDTGSVVFAPATPPLALSAPEFLRWASDYVIGVPLTMQGTAGGGTGHLLIMHPGGGGPPLGMQDPYSPAS